MVLPVTRVPLWFCLLWPVCSRKLIFTVYVSFQLLQINACCLQDCCHLIFSFYSTCIISACAWFSCSSLSPFSWSFLFNVRSDLCLSNKDEYLRLLSSKIRELGNNKVCIAKFLFADLLWIYMSLFRTFEGWRSSIRSCLMSVSFPQLSGCLVLIATVFCVHPVNQRGDENKIVNQPFCGSDNSEEGFLFCRIGISWRN